MKKLLLLISAFALTLAIGCSEDSTSKESDVSSPSGFKLSNKLTDTISWDAYKLGASKFGIKGNLAYYQTEGRTFSYAAAGNPVVVDLAKYSFEFLGNRVTIKGTSNYIETIGGVDYFKLGSFYGKWTAATGGQLNTPEAFILSVVKKELKFADLNLSGSIKELQGGNLVVASYTPPISIGAPCSIWNTYICVGVGPTPSSAISNCNYAFQQSVANDDYVGCVQTGTMEPGFLSGGLVQTISFCCE